jgi:four helix bundle protein
MFPFEKLEVWQKAVDFADSIYRLTTKFPDDERFGRTSQMRRAAVSIASNLAEGSSRHSRNDFGRFIEISTGTLFEVVTQGNIAMRQGFLTEAEYAALYRSAEEQGRMLSGLRRSMTAASGHQPSTPPPSTI